MRAIIPTCLCCLHAAASPRCSSQAASLTFCHPASRPPRLQARSVAGGPGAAPAGCWAPGRRGRHVQRGGCRGQRGLRARGGRRRRCRPQAPGQRGAGQPAGPRPHAAHELREGGGEHQPGAAVGAQQVRRAVDGRAQGTGAAAARDRKLSSFSKLMTAPPPTYARALHAAGESCLPVMPAHRTPSCPPCPPPGRPPARPTPAPALTPPCCSARCRISRPWAAIRPSPQTRSPPAPMQW